ncbi:TIGR03619 family F420-dependent LLM class oxidoreductase [Tenggerimyces flavus]|uniref:TIGR03619 family F420-dependent LLM class oxidoreductase n=1 Tax=Tenggerimyces flavus TaxID=1708749 RepID=A0ABV7YI14_9ACTN|nr:TIGR03619 family F420-dependent LLM class oxidoreductase [Tenggerimyces flavus]MBM7784035.1 putative F420-dependent oxidoreductase [Tenggerimyces flavus]
MRIGFGAPVAGAWATPSNLGSFAARAESLGYASLWTFQRLLVGAGQRLSPVYESVLDPMVALAFAAARTSRIRLGVAVLNAPFLSPAYLAKQAASVDVLSGGRLDLGLGLGWEPEEFAAVGMPMERRGARLAEYVSVLRSAWTTELTSHEGAFYTVPSSRILPKPVQRPGPPVLFGGSAEPALRRAGRLADGWISRSAADLSRIGADVAVIRAAASEAGRDPAALRFVCRGVVEVVPSGLPEGGRRRLSGSVEQIRADVAWLGTQGVTEVFYDLNFDPLIGSPSADPAAATDRASELLEALAPGLG